MSVSIQLALFLTAGFITIGSGLLWQTVSVSVTSAVDYKEYYPEKSIVHCCMRGQRKDRTLACYKDEMCRLIKDDINTITAASTDGWDCKTTGMVTLYQTVMHVMALSLLHSLMAGIVR